MKNSVVDMETEVGEGGAHDLKQNGGGAPAASVGAGAMNDAVSELSKMVQVMLAERERRESEQQEERRRWEVERQTWEEAFMEERRRREEDMALREEQTRMQMEVLQSLVQGIQLQGEAANKRAENDRDVKVPKLTEKDDIVSYLTMFERLMLAYKVKKDKWAFKLAAHLVGKAQEAYAALSIEDARSYEKVKEAILQRFDITEESYRQRFRTTKKKTEESNRELVARLTDLAEKWLKNYQTREELLDQVILEQFLKTLPDDMRVFVRERHPTTSNEASKFADDYVQARKDGAENQKKEGDKSGRRCLRCSKTGHVSRDCRVRLTTPQQQKEHSTSKGDHPKRDPKNVECFNCHKKGHYSFNCLHNALFCTERRADHRGHSFARRRPAMVQPGTMKQGIVEGKSVEDILLDTGCSRTLVHRDLVPEGKIKEGEAVAIRCAHGNTVLYPLAQIHMEVEGRSIEVEAAVSDTLPMRVLLGTDTQELTELLADSRKKAVADALVVSTRSALRKQREADKESSRMEEACGVQPHTLNERESDVGDEDGHQGGGPCEVHQDELGENDETWLSKLDSELFEGGRLRVKLTRSQKREERYHRGRQESLVKDVEDNDMTEAVDLVGQHELDISVEEMKTLQATDPSLDNLREIAETGVSRSGVAFFRREGLLHRRWVPKGRDREMSVEQLVLPQKCRDMVMKLAHTIPLAGHLGKAKTVKRILQRFYWPTIYRDIAKFCRSCESCQLAAGRKPAQSRSISK